MHLCTKDCNVPASFGCLILRNTEGLNGENTQRSESNDTIHISKLTIYPYNLFLTFASTLPTR